MISNSRNLELDDPVAERLPVCQQCLGILADAEEPWGCDCGGLGAGEISAPEAALTMVPVAAATASGRINSIRPLGRLRQRAAVARRRTLCARADGHAHARPVHLGDCT